MSSEIIDRQGFLGPLFPEARSRARLAVVGVSGGGSHVVQHLAHLGFDHPVLFDPDRFGLENLHRHVGSRASDVEEAPLKVDLGRRVVLGVNPAARVEAIPSRWEDDAELLRSCDLIFGCVDQFRARRELEITARRYLIPYIDIGMDVFTHEDQAPRMVGQVILSLPGGPCLECLGVVTDRELALEASRYGADGVQQQVVYANGQLAAAAVGVALDLLTGWSGDIRPSIFLQFDGNRGTIVPSPKLAGRENASCPHFPASDVGDPIGRDL